MFPDLAGSRRRVGARARAPAVQHATRSRRGRSRIPYRYIAHNGEINTLRGNINWMRAREGAAAVATLLGDDLKKILPIIREGGSDTATFDNVLEFLVMAGRSLPHADPDDDSGAVGRTTRSMQPELQGVLRIPLVADGAVGRSGVDRLHRRHGHRRGARSQRPAPVALLRHEGRPRDHGVRKSACSTFRPRTSWSRSGCIPGRIFLVDTVQGRIVSDDEIKNELAREHPYAEWLKQNLDRRSRTCPAAPYLPRAGPRDRAAPAAGRSATRDEDVRLLLAPMAARRRRARSVRWAPTRRWRSLSGPAPAAVRLLQAALRAGDQSAARRDPRRADHVDGVDDRSRSATCSVRARVAAGRSASGIRSSTTISSPGCGTSD